MLFFRKNYRLQPLLFSYILFKIPILSCYFDPSTIIFPAGRIKENPGYIG